MIEEMFLILVQTFSYLGIFFVSMIASAGIIFPIPGFAVIFAAGAALHPLGIGIAAGIGAAIGELTGYGLGWSSKKILIKKYKKQLEEIKELFKKWGGSFIIFLFAVLPLPFDIIGIFCGNIGWGIKRFFIITLLGKIIKYSIVAYAGFYTFDWLISLL